MRQVDVLIETDADLKGRGVQVQLKDFTAPNHVARDNTPVAAGHLQGDRAARVRRQRLVMDKPDPPLGNVAGPDQIGPRFLPRFALQAHNASARQRVTAAVIGTALGTRIGFARFFQAFEQGKPLLIRDPEAGGIGSTHGKGCPLHPARRPITGHTPRSNACIVHLGPHLHIRRCRAGVGTIRVAHELVGQPPCRRRQAAYAFQERFRTCA